MKDIPKKLRVVDGACIPAIIMALVTPIVRPMGRANNLICFKDGKPAKNNLDIYKVKKVSFISIRIILYYYTTDFGIFLIATQYNAQKTVEFTEIPP